MAGGFFAVIVVSACIMPLCHCYPIRNRQKRDTESLETEDNVDRPKVFLTVSSLASYPDEDERLLELNWYNAPLGLNEDDESRVRLYNQDPSDNTSNYLVSVKPWHHAEGIYRTSVQLPQPLFTKDNLTDDCLGFWIAYVHDDEVLASNCIRARPNWMSNYRNIIGRVSLLDLMIPGTHNAGSYASFNPDDDNLFTRYMIAQEESIWNQLVYGIRYLDLRVSYQSDSRSEDHLWITHGHFKTDISIKNVIQQVKTFLNNTNEIVIMDFHRFVTGFNGRRASERHRELINILEEELSEYMIPVAFSSWATLNELWDQNKRLYVGYASNKDRKQSSYLFPAVRQLWGDVDRVDQLYNYLNGTVCSRRQQRLTSAMAQLTPTTTGAIFNTYGGLRKMAQDVNLHVTRWFREDWPQCANIIATDYFLGNNIIETAIQTNRNKFSGTS